VKVKRYGGAYARNRRMVLRASDVCAYCGRDGADTADHIIPVAYGGTHDLDNLRPAHMRCNSAAGGRMHRGKHRANHAKDALPYARPSRWG